MDYSNYVFIGIGVALSVVGFFLRRTKESVDICEKNNKELMVSVARTQEKVKHLEKLLEDRRQDVRKLFDIVSRNGN